MVKSPARSSAPSASSANSASASAMNGSPPALTTTVRHRSTSGMTPGAVARGIRPARSSDDLPDPLAPITSRNGDCRSFATARAIAASRPKNTPVWLASNAASPRNGEPLSLRSQCGPSRDHPLALEPLPQAGGKLRLEVVGIGKALVAGGVVAFVALGPALPDRLQELVLLQLLGDAIGVVDHRRGLAEQEDVGNAVLLAAHVDRGFELEHRPAFVGRAVRAPPDRGIELQAGALPHDAQHHVGCGHVADRAVDGFLERMRRGVERVLPAQHVDAGDALELGIEAVGDQLDAAALRRDVRRRRHEDAQGPLSHGQPSRRPLKAIHDLSLERL